MAERGLDVSRFQIPTHVQESLAELEQELAEGKITNCTAHSTQFTVSNSKQAVDRVF